MDQCEKGREDVLDKKQEAQYVIHITDQSEEILGDGWKPQKRGLGTVNRTGRRG